MKSYDFKVEGMTCASCVTRVEKIINKFDGVKNVSVNLASEKVTFDTESDNVNLDEIASAVREYGYEMKTEKTILSKDESQSAPDEETRDEHFESLKKDFIFALILTLPIFILSMLMNYDFFTKFWPFSGDETRKILLILTTPVIFISGKRFYKIFCNFIPGMDCRKKFRTPRLF